ncbi:hypothetical protein PLICRDRAFT_680308 [Plicaturopsis crispa FD-325 SS-3]|nr:hypothetical protein PLICRDRAFT_680308 [Plicaturopsis crispa FD-325 SS-3]
MQKLRGLLSLALSLSVYAAESANKSHCLSFSVTDPSLNATTLAGTTYYAKGDLVNLTSYGGTTTSNNLAAFCRLELTINTNSTANSSAKTELWLPDDWNSRLLGVGNGGWSGGIVYPALAYNGIQNGFASFSTDTGHQSAVSDGTWALNNPNAILDFASRAMHMSVLASKVITENTGGRQGLKELQLYPESFDGVVVGSPANWLSHLQPWSIHQNLNVLPVNSSQWIPNSLWPVIHDEVLKQCDAIDGVEDGLVSDPQRCIFRPEAITCRPSSNTSTCLIDYYETNGTFIFSGYQPGGELLYPAGSLVGSSVLEISVDYYRDFILNDPTWDCNTLDFATIQEGIRLNPGQMDAVDPNITDFADRGGKLLHYVGWGDPLIAPGNSIHYYESVVAHTMRYSDIDPESFYRLFTVPGMGHCGNGNGPTAFGAESASDASAVAPPGKPDAAHDILLAVVNWVENNTAPAELIATKYVDDNSTLGVSFTRKLCPYPQHSVFTGGDNTTANSFQCK